MAGQQNKPEDGLSKEALAALGLTEMTATLAGMAGAMKRALEHEGFASPVAEPAAIQFMYVMAAASGIGVSQ